MGKLPDLQHCSFVCNTTFKGLLTIFEWRKKYPEILNRRYVFNRYYNVSEIYMHEYWIANLYQTIRWSTKSQKKVIEFHLAWVYSSTASSEDLLSKVSWVKSTKYRNARTESLNIYRISKCHSQLINMWSYHMFSQHTGIFTLSERHLFLWIFIQNAILRRWIYPLTWI